MFNIISPYPPDKQSKDSGVLFSEHPKQNKVPFKLLPDITKSLPFTVKLFKGSSNPCSGLALNPISAPLSKSMKYLGRQFLMCSPKN